MSSVAWKIYNKLDWESKKIMGLQFITAVDSIGANIAEGYTRFHYLDKIKFFYNSRGSFSEAKEHWLELLKERNKVSQEDYKVFKTISERLSLKLNNFISSTYKAKNISTNFH